MIQVRWGLKWGYFLGESQLRMGAKPRCMRLQSEKFSAGI